MSKKIAAGKETKKVPMASFEQNLGILKAARDDGMKALMAAGKETKKVSMASIQPHGHLIYPIAVFDCFKY